MCITDPCSYDAICHCWQKTMKEIGGLFLRLLTRFLHFSVVAESFVWYIYMKVMPDWLLARRGQCTRAWPIIILVFVSVCQNCISDDRGQKLYRTDKYITTSQAACKFIWEFDCFQACYLSRFLLLNPTLHSMHLWWGPDRTGAAG